MEDSVSGLKLTTIQSRTRCWGILVFHTQLSVALRRTHFVRRVDNTVTDTISFLFFRMSIHLSLFLGTVTCARLSMQSYYCTW